MSTLPNSPMLLDSTGQVIAQKLQGIINALGGGGGTVIIEEYDSSVLRYPNTGETGGYTYKVGDYCSYNNSIYFCNTPINWNATTPPAFDSTKWYDATDDIVTELSKKPGIVITSGSNPEFIELFGNVGTHNVYNSGHDFSHVEGCYNTLGKSDTPGKLAYASHVEGQSNVAAATTTHIEGYSNTSYGSYSHAEGQYNTIGSDSTWISTAHVEGYSNGTYGNYSHVEGQGNINYGSNNHVEGRNNSSVHGSYNHVEGESNSLTSDVNCNYNHIEGASNTIYKNGTTNQPAHYAHMEGGSNTIYGGNYHHAEGYNNRIYGPMPCHAEGHSNYANGPFTHVGGQSSYAGAYGRFDAAYAFAHGYNVYAYNSCETAFGAFNDSKDGRKDIYDYAESGTSYAIDDQVRYEGSIYKANEAISSPAGAFDPSKWTYVSDYSLNPTIFSVGNGVSSNAKSNAFEVLSDGTGYLKNDKRIITTEEVPDPPTTDGTYTLQVTVNNGQLTYEWV